MGNYTIFYIFLGITIIGIVCITILAFDALTQVTQPKQIRPFNPDDYYWDESMSETYVRMPDGSVRLD